jgi:hypothetical protein
MPSWDPLGANLLFVISQPRSGSTLLQKILGSHSFVHTVSEPWIALHPIFGGRASGIATEYGSRLALDGRDDFLRRLRGGEEVWWEAVRLMLGHLYGRALEESGRRIFLDKTPRYYFIISELRRVFPRAHLVLLVRNPLAVLASVIETWAPDNSPELLRKFRQDLCTAPRLIAQAMINFPECPVVRYEELAASPAATVASLCERLDLPFEAGMIDYGASAAGRERFRYGDEGTVYRESRPVADRIARWQATLDSPVRRAWARGYLESLGPEIVTALGYPYDELLGTFPPQPGLEGAWAELVNGGAARRTVPA